MGSYEVNCAIAEQLDDGLPPVYWLPQSADPQIRRRRLRDYGLFAKSTVTPTTAETITIDKWFEPAERPIDRARSRSTYSVTAKDLIGRAENVSLDRFQQPQAEPRRDLSRKQYLFPVSVSDYLSQIPGAEVIRLDKWGRNYPDLVFRARRLPDYGQWTIDPTLRAERASVDKWSQPSNRPRFDPKRYLWLYPSFSSDAQLYVRLGVEIIRVDKWAQPQPVPRRDLKRLQHLFPHLGIDAAFFVVLGTDYPAYDRDFGIIVLRTAETGTLALLTIETGSTELLTNITGTLSILTEEVGELD